MAVKELLEFSLLSNEEMLFAVMLDAIAKAN